MIGNQLRAGLIGCGNVAITRHIPALLGLDGVKVSGVADPTEANRDQARAALQLSRRATHADHRALLETGIDYAVVAVPPIFRPAIVADCAQAGVHVLTEKPLAIVPAEGQAMIDRMEAADLRFGLMHNWLFFPEYRLAYNLVQKGSIGRLRHVTLQQFGMRVNPGNANYKHRWRHDFDYSGGGILIDQVHLFYLSTHFMGRPIQAVSAVVDNFDRPDEQVEEFAIVHLHFEGGYVTANTWWGQGPNGFELSGTEGYIVHFKNNRSDSALSQVTVVNGEGSHSLSTEKAETNPYTDSFAAIHDDFVQALLEGRPPLAPATTGLAALEGVVAAYGSAATGQVIQLPLQRQGPLYKKGAAGIRELAVRPDSPVRIRGLFGFKE
jgi:predicted dehydrogenase